MIGLPSSVQVICGSGDPTASHLSENFDPGSRIVPWNRCVNRGGDVGSKSRLNRESSEMFLELFFNSEPSLQLVPLKEAVTKLVQSENSKSVVKMIVNIGKFVLEQVLAYFLPLV